MTDMLTTQISDKLISSFPNVYIALRICVSISGTNCYRERSFSKVNLIKNCLCSSMGQQRLSSLALLSIENEILRDISFENVISEFAMRESESLYLMFEKNRYFFVPVLIYT